MAKNTLSLVTPGQAVGVGGYVGAGAFVAEIPLLDVGTGPRNDGTVSFSFGLTKTAGGNIDPSTESLRLLRSSDGTNFCELYESNGDSSPVNYLAGQNSASVKKSLEIRAKPGQSFKLVYAGDGVADTCTLDFAFLDV